MAKSPPESPKQSTQKDSKSPERKPVPKEDEAPGPPSEQQLEREKLAKWRIPESFRAIVKFDETDKGNFVTYEDLASYLKQHRDDDDVLDNPDITAADVPNVNDSPTVLVDMSDTQIYAGPMPSLDILPWLFVYIRCPGVQFVARAHHVITDRICKFVSELIIPNKEFWMEGVVVNKRIREVNVFFHMDRSLDLVLEPGSDWARDWDCVPYFDLEEINSMRVFAACLGLNLVEWEGHIVVASVEGQDR